MRNKLLVFGLAAALLALGVYTASEYFEIYPEEVREGPSLEAQMNAYLALERWLETTGHPVQVLTNKPDETVFSRQKSFCVQASGLEWTEKINAGLFSFVKNGGFVFLYLDGQPEDRGLRNFLSELGIRIQSAEAASPQPVNDADPDFDRRFILKPVKENPNRPGMRSRKDSGGAIRLISVTLGQGAITLSAGPRFMRTRNLQKKANARLAWELTGAKDSAGEGIVFIRDRATRDSLYDAFSAHGNLVFVIVSALVLIVTGFWMVIPVFGRPKTDRERPGRPLRERFLAEGSFLKKFKALDVYLDMYRKEIQFKSRLGEASGAESLARQLAPRCGMDESAVREALVPRTHGRAAIRVFPNCDQPRNNIKFRDFIKQRKILKTLWESL